MDEYFENRFWQLFYEALLRIAGAIPIIGLILGPMLAFIIVIHSGKDGLEEVKISMENQKKEMWEKVKTHSGSTRPY